MCQILRQTYVHTPVPYSVFVGVGGKVARGGRTEEGDCQTCRREKVSDSKSSSPFSPSPRKQAFLRLQQRSSAAKQECVALLQQLNAAVSSCAHPALLPEAASKAYQTGCQVLVAVQAMLEQQRDLDEEQVRC